jgi:hypothetical protein
MNDANEHYKGAVAALSRLAGSAWTARGYTTIPGPECRSCHNTGYTIMHGAPRSGRTGLPTMNNYCSDCGRDPIQFLHDEVIRKTSSPNKADMTSGSK